jgi:uncharacterized protein YpuA (DUF1002 family)
MEKNKFWNNYQKHLTEEQKKIQEILESDEFKKILEEIKNYSLKTKLEQKHNNN